jgi:hypothetical protein
MEPLPMAPSCSLDEDGLRRQLQRYREAGRGARALAIDSRSLLVELREGAPSELVEELIAVERECCPFFTLDWQPERRRLAVAVSTSEHEPALEAIAFALGLERGAAPAPLR